MNISDASDSVVGQHLRRDSVIIFWDQHSSSISDDSIVKECSKSQREILLRDCSFARAVVINDASWSISVKIRLRVCEYFVTSPSEARLILNTNF